MLSDVAIPRSKRQRPPDMVPWAVLLATMAGVSVGTAIYTGLNSVTDFIGFLESGRALASGSNPYFKFSGNLNPPLVTAVFFRPLAGLSFRAAFLVWTVMSLACWLFMVVGLAPRRRWWWLLASGTWGGLWIGLKIGQVGMVLALLLTAIYVADRQGRSARAGALLGIALAWKPFVGLIAVWWLLTRRWTALMAAVLAFVAVIAGQIGIWGWPMFANWLNELQNTTSVNLFHDGNASLLGLCARLGVGTTIGVVLAVVAAVVSLAVAVRGTRASAWLALTSASLLASPLGWNYYIPLALVPLADKWDEVPRWKGRWLMLALLSIPPVPATPLATSTKLAWGTVQTLALLALLIYSATSRPDAAAA